MDWEKLKEEENEKLARKVHFEESRELWNQLNETLKGKYVEFNKKTKPMKYTLFKNAIDGFKNYFTSKGFEVLGNGSDLNAKYNDINIVLGTDDKEYSFTLHFYIGKKLRECRVFNVSLAEEFQQTYKTVYAGELNDFKNIEELKESIQKLESNIKSMDAIIADKDKISFMYELDSYHSGMSGNFQTIDAILDTLNK